MQATVKIEFGESERARITDKVSTALGSFIQATGKFDFSQWTPEEWQRFCGIAFDIVAPDVFLKRLVLVPPYEVEGEHVPY